MHSFTFGIRFRFDSTEFYETSFDLALSDEEVDFVKAFLREKGDMPFWAFEFENEALFARMLEAHVAAIISYVNREVVKPSDEPFTEETIDWDCVLAEFDWPKQFLES